MVVNLFRLIKYNTLNGKFKLIHSAYELRDTAASDNRQKHWIPNDKSDFISSISIQNRYHKICLLNRQFHWYERRRVSFQLEIIINSRMKPTDRAR